MADELKNGQVIQMYEKPLREDGTPGDDNTPQFPITVSGAVMHGNGTIDQELEKLKYLADFQKLAENLTDGQAVTAQVAKNTLDIANKADKKELDRKTDYTGYYGAMGVGYAMEVFNPDPSGKFGEAMPGGRPFGDAGQLTPQAGAENFFTGTGMFADGTSQHFPSDVSGKSTLSVKEVGGMCLGEGQMAPSSWGPVRQYKENDFMQCKSFGLLHKFLCAASFLNSSGIAGHLMCDLANGGNTYGGQFLLQIFSEAEWKGTASIATSVNVLNNGIWWRKWSAGELQMKDTTLLDLTLLFPSPSGQALVAKLDSNEASCLCVANLLGCFAYHVTL